MQIEKLFC